MISPFRFRKLNFCNTKSSFLNFFTFCFCFDKEKLRKRARHALSVFVLIFEFCKQTNKTKRKFHLFKVELFQVIFVICDTILKCNRRTERNSDRIELLPLHFPQIFPDFTEENLKCRKKCIFWESISRVFHKINH